MRKGALLILLIISGTLDSGAQALMGSASYRPYTGQFGSYSKSVHTGRNIDYNLSYFFGNYLLLGVTYNAGNWSLVDGTSHYSMKHQLVKLGVGQWVTSSARLTRYNCWQLNLNFARVDHQLDIELTDSYGTTFREHHEKERWEFGIEACYTKYIPLTQHIYLRGMVSFVLTPLQTGNPFDNLYHHYDILPAYSPAGGAAYIFNVLFAAGVGVRVPTNSLGN